MALRGDDLVLEDDLDLDGVTRVEVLAVVGDRLPVHDVLRAALAQLERVRVAVHREEGVARAVAGGVRVRLRMWSDIIRHCINAQPVRARGEMDA